MAFLFYGERTRPISSIAPGQGSRNLKNQGHRILPGGLCKQGDFVMTRTVKNVPAKNVPAIPMFFLAFAVLAAPAALAPVMAATGVASPIQPLRADQARANEGQNITVQGMAADIHRDQRFGAYLDIDSHGPSPVFAGFIPKGNEGQFPAIENLRGHVVAITGVIRIRDGYPIIQMTDASQLRILR
jgi:hypothetical protein